jgi:hypothetical protein
VLFKSALLKRRQRHSRPTNEERAIGAPDMEERYQTAHAMTAYDVAQVDATNVFQSKRTTRIEAGQ